MSSQETQDDTGQDTLFREVQSTVAPSEFSCSKDERSNRQKADEASISASPGNTSPELLETQLKYCSSIITRLKRNQNVGPFLHPVDVVAFGIPDYYDKIKHPMDISTIRAKLDRRPSVSKVPNSDSYGSAEEFHRDIKLIFSNCYYYNGVDSPVSIMAKELEKLFDSLWVDLPKEVAKKTQKRQFEEQAIPKRTKQQNSPVNSPPNANLNTTPLSNNINSVLNELEKNRNRKITWPFLLPVNPEEVPGYHDIIGSPMDLSTVRSKIPEYKSIQELEGDLQLIVDNCKLFNPENTDVYKLGEEFEILYKKVLDDFIYHTNITQTRRTLESEIDELRRKISEFKSKLAVLEQTKAHSTGKKVFTIADREELGRLILNMGKDESERVVDIIQRNCSNFQYIGNDEIEINLHCLPDHVLCEIEDFTQRLDKKDIIDAVSDSG